MFDGGVVERSERAARELSVSEVDEVVMVVVAIMRLTGSLADAVFEVDSHNSLQYRESKKLVPSRFRLDRGCDRMMLYSCREVVMSADRSTY